MDRDSSRRVRDDLSRLQRKRKAAIAATAVLVLSLLPFIQSSEPMSGPVHETIEIVGLGLIGVSIMARAWCTFYIGGRKAGELVDLGPYSVTRNPLYMSSFLGAAGAGLQSGSVAAGAIFAAGAFLLFLPVVLAEERALRALFGPAFEDYCRRVPRFLPRVAGWRDVEMVTVRPATLWRTLRDGLVFFMVVPLFETIEKLQDAGVFVPFLHLP